LFHTAKRIERSVCTPGALRMRASSITIAVPEPLSLAGLAEADAVHVRADDDHLVRPRAADLGAVEVLAHRRALRRGFGIQCAQALVGLRHRVGVDAGGAALAEERAATRPGRAAGACRRFARRACAARGR
jgi:hypothetical protein